MIIAYPNGDITTRETFDETTNSIIKNLSLKRWKSVGNLVLKHPQLKQYIREAIERGVSEEFNSLSKSETILKGRKVDEIIAFSNKLLIHKVSLLCPLWYACLKGACGKGICMSPDSTVHFQRKFGKNYDSKILLWKKPYEQDLSALNMLEVVKANQVPALEKDDMEITIDINLDEEIIKGYAGIEPSAYGYCKNLLIVNVMSRRKEDSVNNDTIEEAIVLLNNNLPIYK